MKHKVILSLLFMLLIAGCQEEYKGHKPGRLSVNIQGGQILPDFLTDGKWDGGESGWIFEFAEDGTITEAVISLGRTPITPGKITKMPTKLNGQAVYVPGDWKVDYDISSRELTIDIVMDYVEVEFGNRVLIGRTEDVLTGFISEDGSRWDATVYNIPEFELLPNNPDDIPYVLEAKFKKVQKDN